MQWRSVGVTSGHQRNRLYPWYQGKGLWLSTPKRSPGGIVGTASLGGPEPELGSINLVHSWGQEERSLPVVPLEALSSQVYSVQGLTGRTVTFPGSIVGQIFYFVAVAVFLPFTYL